ncbi:hypothetical protein JZ751_014289 [Albula glossodonta]|uniref:Uncharacterized protein n=1 Tax=Albula glossodonta TaxID=121402 RepID=A0A8T2P0Y5_9TELE|nr:hypothetical protein JZ751_014289 [Albula glossodonta]
MTQDARLVVRMGTEGFFIRSSPPSRKPPFWPELTKKLHHPGSGSHALSCRSLEKASPDSTYRAGLRVDVAVQV